MRFITAVVTFICLAPHAIACTVEKKKTPQSTTVSSILALTFLIVCHAHCMPLHLSTNYFFLSKYLHIYLSKHQ